MNNAAEREKGESPSGLAATPLLARRCGFVGRSFVRGGGLTRREAARLFYQAPATVPKVRFYIVKQLKMLSVYAIIYLLK